MIQLLVVLVLVGLVLYVVGDVHSPRPRDQGRDSGRRRPLRMRLVDARAFGVMDLQVPRLR